MDLYCAVDLISGQAVRLVRGDFAARHEFGDPLELVRRYGAAGARWVHVVDLDAARTGEPVNRATLFEIVRLADALGMEVQAGGGVRSAADAAALISGGVRRVVVGTAAQRDPALLVELCAAHPGGVAVGLDHRGGGSRVAVSGWAESSGRSLEEALGRLEDLPLDAIVVTAIERDGMMEGPDLAGLRTALASSSHQVIASGGVRSGADLVSLASLDVEHRRLSGAIVGMALVNGTLEVKEALSACEASG